MRFYIDRGDGSRISVDSAEKVEEYRRWHGDEYGGIERIRIESDSGRESSSVNHYDLTWAARKEREYAKYDGDYRRERESLNSDSDSSPNAYSQIPTDAVARPTTKGEWYGGMVLAFLALMLVASVVPFIVGEMISFFAAIILLIIIGRGIWDLGEWVLDRF